MFPNLTVREMVHFSALLRLPNTMTVAEKIQRGEDVIREVCSFTISFLVRFSFVPLPVLHVFSLAQQPSLARQSSVGLILLYGFFLFQTGRRLGETY